MIASEVNAAVGTADNVTAGRLRRLLTDLEYAGVPTGNVTPDFRGQMLFDTANSDYYIATGTANTAWKKIT